ncbi:hypothetical protein MAM1_0056c03621 [Mucor ambiguus]|uniref:Uncharacterized protein n=1 Tax=Mucor ambiguus TaxID=91626 RepID=A0A0C9M4H5_9FUNG|nr:hypothetical protein MAM1_0056c03621 [Mucor ambiguus]
MLTTRKILLDITDGCTKQESLDVFKMAKSESDLPSLNDYKKLSSASEKTPTSAPLDIKVKTEEADTKLALEALSNKETGYSNEIKIKQYRPKINSYGKWTPDSQGE